jgi:hypothetical protein|tara:strand:+ start:5743 stop:6405 length:663 start_codon:yes stop_codon:yes gene_type:complete
MKFSENTLTILKSFSTINKSILLKPGSALKTITPEKTLVATATIAEQIPSQACIYDLSRFLSILGLYRDPDVEFHDKYFTIAEGKQRTKYAFADISMIHAAPEKDIELPSSDVIVDVMWDDMQSVIKAAGVLQFNEVAFVGSEGKVYLKAINSADQGADDYGVEIGTTQDEFKVIIKTDNLKLLPQNYHVTLCAKGISEFKGETATYYVAIDTKSTYQKG